MSRIAVFTSENKGFCVTRDKITFSMQFSDDKEKAIQAFAKHVPPNTVCATYVEREEHCDLPTLKRLIPALKAAGYKNIRVFSTLCRHTSLALNVAELKCKVGDHVGVTLACDGFGKNGIIVEKTANGYKFVALAKDMRTEVKKDPAVKHVIVKMCHPEYKEELEKEYETIFRGREIRFHFNFYDEDDYLSKFIWNKYDGGNLNGNLVAEISATTVWFAYLDQCIRLDFRLAELPYSKTFKIDIWKAIELPIYATYDNDEQFGVILLTYDSTAQRRIVEATVSMGLDHILDVKVITVECEVPKLTMPIRPKGKRADSTAIIMSVDRSAANYSVCQGKNFNTKAFNNFAAMMKDLQEAHPPRSVEAVLYMAESVVNLNRLREFRTRLQNAGYTNVKTVKSEYYSYALVLQRYKLNVAEGETVAILCHEMHCILSRHGTKFRVLHVAFLKNGFPTELFDPYEVSTVIVDASFQDECDISKFGDRKIIVSEFTKANETNYVSCIWSMIDGTDFDHYAIEESQFVIFKVVWNGKSKLFKTDFVPMPYEWTVELDVEKASTLRVDAKLFVPEPMESEFSEIKSFNIAKFGSDKVAITFCINSAYHVAARCVALPRGRSPMPTSLCLWIERTANGFQKTVYFRNSGKTVIDKCPNLFVALESFKQAEYAAVFFNATATTEVERAKWKTEAKKYGFKDLQFVNGPVLALNSILCDVDPVEFGENTTVLVGDMTAVDKNGQKAPMTYVLRSRQKKLKLQKVVTAKVDKVYSTLDSVDHVFVATDDTIKLPKLPEHLNSVILKKATASVSKYLFSRVDDQSDAKPIVDDIAGVTFVAEWTGGKQVFDAQFETVPFSRDVALHVGPVKTLRIDTTSLNLKKRELLKEFSFKTEFDRLVHLKLAVDSMLLPSVTHVRSDPAPSTTFEFTADNRVIVHSDAVGKHEYPAYVSFGDNVLVGESALRRFKTHPETVVYDVHRFFAPDFDPTHPDPTWHFKTSRGKNNETTIHIGESTTTSTVCFGTIVSAVKRDGESKGNCTLTDIGIRMPSGIVVPEDVCSVIGNMLNAKLVLLM